MNDLEITQKINSRVRKIIMIFSSWVSSPGCTTIQEAWNNTA